MTPPWQRWLSAHLHFSAPTIYGPEVDEVIARLVAPLVTTIDGLDGFFFIRYSQDGPHIRLRLRESSARRAAATREVVENAYREITTSSRSSSVRLIWANYEPEIARYGGLYALAVSERLFEASSEAAIGLIEGSSLTMGSRLGKALLAMLATVYVLLPSPTTARMFGVRYCGGFLPSLASWRGRESQDLAESFSRGLAPQQASLMESIEEAWGRFERRDSVSPAIDRYVASLRELCSELRRCFDSGKIIVAGDSARTWGACVQWLLPSYVHMMNNRLGVSIEHEAYLAYIIQNGLAVMEPASVRLPPADGVST